MLIQADENEHQATRLKITRWWRIASTPPFNHSPNFKHFGYPLPTFNLGMFSLRTTSE